MKNITIILTVFLCLFGCKDKKKEIEIKTDFQNSKIGFDFFCNPNVSTELMYYEKNMDKESYRSIITCDNRYGSFRLLIESMEIDEGVWLTLSELSCINNECIAKEKPSEHLMGEPDGELRFRVINKEVIKLVGSNIRHLGYQDSDIAIPYSKAKDFFNLKKDIYIFKRRSDLRSCPMSRIIVDTEGENGVSCGEEIPETIDKPNVMEKIEHQ